MKEKGLTQAALARRMNCTQQYVSKILKGKENMSLDIICRLENALKINIIADEPTANHLVADNEVPYSKTGE